MNGPAPEDRDMTEQLSEGRPTLDPPGKVPA
jgi:hypothetical protein